MLEVRSTIETFMERKAKIPNDFCLVKILKGKTCHSNFKMKCASNYVYFRNI